MVLRIEPYWAVRNWNALVAPFAGTVDTSYMDIPKVVVVKRTVAKPVA